MLFKKHHLILCCLLSTLASGSGCNNNNTPTGDAQTDHNSADNTPADDSAQNDQNSDQPQTDSEEILPDDEPTDNTDSLSKCPDCGPYGTCNEETGVCVCGGNFTGTRCDYCKDRYTGATCDECISPYAGAACNECEDEGWAGIYCEKCQENYYGPDCTPCNCQTGEYCLDGINGDGTCDSCQDGKTNGPACDKCLPNHYGPDCKKCDCVNGTCNDGIDGDGTCTCKENFTGASCNECVAGHYGRYCKECTCSSHGQCNEGINGNGTCDCKAYYWGSNCENICDNCINGYCNDGATGNGYCKKCYEADLGRGNWTGSRCDQCAEGWAGEKCDDCDENHFGPTCEPCAYSNGTLCEDSKNGEVNCDYGVEGTGWCVCGNGYFTGSSCTVCDWSTANFSNYYYKCKEIQGSTYPLSSLTYPVVNIDTKPPLNWLNRNSNWDGCTTCQNNKQLNGDDWIGYECASCTKNVGITPYVTFDPAKQSLTATAFGQWQDNWQEHTSYLENYGYYYSWEDAKKVCPNGWRLPTKKELEQLVTYVNENTGAMILINNHSLLWNNMPSTLPASTNVTGLSAEPGGRISSISNHNYYTALDQGEKAIFWSGTQKSSNGAYALVITLTGVSVQAFNTSTTYLPVRCVQM